MKFRILLLTLILPLSSSFVGCGRTHLYPEINGVQLSSTEKEEILSKLRARDLEVSSFRGLGRVHLTEGDESGSFRQIVVFKKPDKLRLESIPTQGAVTLNLLVAQSGRTTLVDPQSKVAIRSNDSEGLINQYLKLPVRGEDLMSYLVGRIPPRFLSSGDISVTFDRESSLYALVRNHFSEYFLLDAKTLAAKEIQLRSHFDDHLSLTIRYDSSTDSVPPGLTISFPRENREISLQWSSRNVNGEYSEKLFNAEIPEDYSVRER